MYDSQARKVHNSAAVLMMDASDEQEDEDESLMRLRDLEASAAAAADDDWICPGNPSESHAFEQRRGNPAKHVYNAGVSFILPSCAHGRRLRGRDEDEGTTTKKLQLLMTEQSVSIGIHFSNGITNSKIGLGLHLPLCSPRGGCT